jgi:hypothetical protein
MKHLQLAVGQLTTGCCLAGSKAVKQAQSKPPACTHPRPSKAPEGGVAGDVGAAHVARVTATNTENQAAKQLMHAHT